MRKFQVTVNGNTYEVEVAEIDAGMPGQAPVVSTPHVSAPKSPLRRQLHQLHQLQAVHCLKRLCKVRSSVYV